MVYIAGPISDPDSAQCARNIERGKAWAATIMQLDFAVYCPHCDHSVVGRTALTLQQVYAMCLEILLRCDAMFVMPDSEGSIGTQGEIAFCKEHRIPIFTSMTELDEWRKRAELEERYGEFEG